MKLFCPYCTKEIGSGYPPMSFLRHPHASETIQLLTEIVKDAAEDGFSERRQFIRIPKKFKIVYSTSKAFVEHYLSNISQGGVFIPTNAPLEAGTQCDLKLSYRMEKKKSRCFVRWFGIKRKK